MEERASKRALCAGRLGGRRLMGMKLMHDGHRNQTINTINNNNNTSNNNQKHHDNIYLPAAADHVGRETTWMAEDDDCTTPISKIPTPPTIADRVLYDDGLKCMRIVHALWSSAATVISNSIIIIRTYLWLQCLLIQPASPHLCICVFA